MKSHGKKQIRNLRLKILRFECLYRNAEHVKSLTWYLDGKIIDNMLQHSADSLQWNIIDLKFLKFECDARNLRLGLSTNGMNPYGNMSSIHNTWLVVLTIYNFSPWLCMKHKFIMLSLLILGPKQLGNNIDVYLASLIEDLKLMRV